MPKFKKFLIGFLLFTFLFQANFVFALEIKYPPVPNTLSPQEIEQGIKNGSIGEEDRLGLYFKYYFNLSLIIIIIICAGVIVYGGVLYLTAAGKATVLVSARQWITSGILGLLILFSSYLILVTINPQLTIFPSHEIKEAGKPFVPYKEKKGVITFFQVPTGALIEKTLNTVEEATTSAKTGQKITKIEAAIEDVEEASENLKKELVQLNYLTTEKCNCGLSNCTGITEVGLDRTRCKCVPKVEEPCRIDCDIDEIKAQMATVSDAIYKLKVARMELVNAQMPLINNYLELRKAGMLMSLELEQTDYSQFLYFKQTEEEKGENIVEIKSFSGWPETLQGTKITWENLVEEIKTEAQKAKVATTTNAASCHQMIETCGEFSTSTESISEKLSNVLGAVDFARKEKTTSSIAAALTAIDDLLSTYSTEFNALETTITEIDNLADNIQEANLEKIEIKERCQKIRDLISESKGELSYIQILKTEIEATDDLNEKLNKLSLIKLRALRIGSYVFEIAGTKQVFIDPASFYFKYATAESEESRKETERLNPLIIFSNICPAEFNAQIAQVLKEALGTDIFQFTTTTWDDLVNESINEGVSESFTDFLERLGKAISEKMRKKLVDNIIEKTESSTTTSLFFKIALAQDTRYGEKVLREKLREELNEKLKTELDPWLENILITWVSDTIANTIAKNAPELLDPETYDKIHQAFSEVFYTEIKDIPFLSETLSKRIVDYAPSLMADQLTLINDKITEVTDEFKASVTQQLTKFVNDFITKLGKTLGIGSEFLEAITEATSIILEDITGEYIDMVVLEKTPIYEIQYELGIWLETTVFDILPKDWQDTLEEELIDLLPQEAAQFFKNIDDVIVAIRDALTPHAQALAAELAESRYIVDILFPGLRETLNKTIYELLVENEPFKSFFESKFKDKLPPELTQSLYNFFPQFATTTIVDMFSSEYADILKNKRLIDLVEPESKRNLLITEMKKLTPEQREALLGMFDESLLDMMDATSTRLLKSNLFDLMSPEAKDFWQSSFISGAPDEFKQTVFQILGIDDRNTSENEARSKRLVDYTTPSTIAVVDLTQQYLPDPDDRPPLVNKIIEIANKTPKRIIAEELLRPDLADQFDTPLPDLLDPNATSTKVLNTSWAEILSQAVGVDIFNQSLLDILKEKETEDCQKKCRENCRKFCDGPDLVTECQENCRERCKKDVGLYSVLTSKIGDLVTEGALSDPANQEKTMIDLLAEGAIEKLYPGLSDSEKAQKAENLAAAIQKPIIEVGSWSFLGKSIWDIVKEDLCLDFIFSKSFYDFFPPEIRESFEIIIGEMIKNKHPFNQRIIDILPADWQKKINDFFGLTEQDIYDAIDKTIDEIDIEREVNECFGREREKMAETMSQALLKKISEKTGKKVDKAEIAAKIDKGIKEVLKPLIKKAVQEKLKKGYLLNSLKDL